MDLARVLVVTASSDDTNGGGDLSRRLNGSLRATVSPEGAAQHVDRASIDVCIVAADTAEHQEDAVRRLKRLPGGPPVLAEVPANDAATVLRLLRLGVDGVVSPEADADTLVRCCEAAALGQVVLPREAVRPLVDEFRLAGVRGGRSNAVLRGLSDREREVAVLLYSGLSTAEVAERLFVSSATVRSHMHAIQRKLQASSREDVFRLLDQN